MMTIRRCFQISFAFILVDPDLVVNGFAFTTFSSTTRLTRTTTTTTTKHTTRINRQVPDLVPRPNQPSTVTTLNTGILHLQPKHRDGYFVDVSSLLPKGDPTSAGLHMSSSNADLGSDKTTTATTLVGDDAAYFSWEDEKWQEWLSFTVATSTVLALVAWIWVLPMGLHGGDVFLSTIQNNILSGSTDPAATVFVMLCIFAVFHSGLAGLRTYAEPIVGPRPWRVLFAMVSLPLALSCVSYFVNHAHDGVQLWQINPNHDPTVSLGVHSALWMVNFISFLFLYPSTFNLLEVAAIQPPQLHLWETGITRITRHPQAVGQIMWCLAHTAWLGTSTAVAASSVLTLHHVFATYHGDRRLEYRHGADFEYIKSKTSIVPFQAIWEGRQKLPKDYWKEFLRAPYLVVTIGTIGAYLAHPYMQAGAAVLNW